MRIPQMIQEKFTQSRFKEKVVEKKNKQKKIEKEDPMAHYDPKDRDFQRTENDMDSVSKSERDALNKRTEKANTKPDKNKL